MIQVERHIIKKTNKNFKTLDNLCFLSKNLYNSCLYFIKNHKESVGDWIRYNELEKEFKTTNQKDYFALPTNTSQQIMMLVDKNLKSYFNLLKLWKNDKTKLNGCPKFPKYKHKIRGRNVVVFTENQARQSKGIIKFPKKVGLSPLKTKITGKLNQVRIIPNSNCYIIEVVYERPIQSLIEPNLNYLSIDLGLNNLTTCFDTTSNTSFILNGKPLKSMNQFYNKKKSDLQSNLKTRHNRYSSKATNRLNFKRNNKIKDYLHKCSRFIVNYCLEFNISNVVLGYNKEWKQEISIGKRNNQNFVNIPFAILLSQIQYKSELVGIQVQLTEESYTSKCSSLDLEELCKHGEYKGKRIKRGMFKSANGTKINADLNGAINILRKVTTDKEQEIVQTLSSRGQVCWPVKVNFHKF